MIYDTSTNVKLKKKRSAPEASAEVTQFKLVLFVLVLFIVYIVVVEGVSADLFVFKKEPVSLLLVY